MAKKIIYYSHNDDPCDSQYECNVVNSLIEREIRYEFKPEQLPYEFPVQGGQCNACGSDKVIQHRVFGADVRLRDSDLLIEIKGKWAGRGYPHKRNLATYMMRRYPYQIAWIFLTNSSIGYGSKTRNTEWAMKYRAFDAATGLDIPPGWADREWVEQQIRFREEGRK